MAATPERAVLDAWTELGQVLAWSGLTTDEWTKVATALGQSDLSNLLLISAIDDDDYLEVRKELSPVKRGALNLTVAAIKAKFNLATRLLPQITTGPASTAASSSSGLAVAANAAAATAAQAAVGHSGMKVSLGTVLNQAMTQEIPLLPEAELQQYRNVYVQVEGDEPSEQCDASDAQITALRFTIEQDVNPYADFGVFGPHGLRLERRQKFQQHTMDPSGRWHATEQPGPASIEAWRECWSVYSTVAIMLNIATPATLNRYARRFEERAGRYPRAWHMCHGRKQIPIGVLSKRKEAAKEVSRRPSTHD